MIDIFLSIAVAVRTLLVPCPCTNATNYNYQLIEKHQLPVQVVESSGLANVNNHFYTINDSGNEPVLYLLDSNFRLIDTLVLPNSKNVDWEDLATDNLGNIYIGDIGNNNNKRKNLSIIKYNVKNNLAETISYHYENQSEYPPISIKDRNFDSEALIWMNHYLYLFSKNKRNKQINIYQIPDKQGNYVARQISQVKLNEKITAATFDSVNQQIIVLTYGKIIIYQVDSLNSLSIYPIYCKRFLRARQSEAIEIFHQKILITNEQRKGYVFYNKAKK